MSKHTEKMVRKVQQYLKQGYDTETIAKKMGYTPVTIHKYEAIVQKPWSIPSLHVDIPKTENQADNFSRIVSAPYASVQYMRQLKNWHNYIHRSRWYLRSKHAYQAHTKASVAWNANHKNKAKYHRLLSYFRNFTKKRAFVPDLTDELEWLNNRWYELNGNPASQHHLKRNSSSTFLFAKDRRAQRLHRQYRSYAHRYITIIDSMADWKQASDLVQATLKIAKNDSSRNISSKKLHKVNK